MRWFRTHKASGAVAVMLTVGAAGHLTVSALASSDTTIQRNQVLATIPLTDDDAGKALFPDTTLVPGRPVSRCLRVVHRGTAGTDRLDVRLAARDLRGALASRLGIVVEVGTGGGFASCSGFQGHTVYTGPLSGLATSSGIATGWTPEPVDARTYRITVSLGRAAPGRATTTLQWYAAAAGPDAPPRPPSASPSGPPVVVPPSTGPRPSAASEQPVAPAPAACQGSGLAADIARALQALSALATRSSRDSRYPIAVLLAILLFLIFQRWIDRRDPKLKLAPLTGARYAYLSDADDEAPAGSSTTPERALRLAVPQADSGGRHGSD